MGGMVELGRVIANKRGKNIKLEVKWQYGEPSPSYRRLMEILLRKPRDNQTAGVNGEKNGDNKEWHLRY